MNKNIIKFSMASFFAAGFTYFPPAKAQNLDHEITQAQAELAKQPLTITSKNGQKHEFSVELAKTPSQQEVGEMFRNNIPDNGGMLFIWPTPQQSDMWMKNTVVSLDMVFIDANHRVQAIAENTVPYSLAPISSHGPVIATLELKGGVTEKLGIAVGDTVSSPAFEVAQAPKEPQPAIKTETKKK